MGAQKLQHRRLVIDAAAVSDAIGPAHMIDEAESDSYSCS